MGWGSYACSRRQPPSQYNREGNFFYAGFCGTGLSNGSRPVLLEEPKADSAEGVPVSQERPAARGAEEDQAGQETGAEPALATRCATTLP